ALGEHLDLAVVDGDEVVTGLDRGRERPEGRVVLQQVPQRPRVGDVVDRDEIEGDLALESRSEEVPADAAEAIDAYLRGHGSFLRVSFRDRLGRFPAVRANLSTGPYGVGLGSVRT